MRDAVRAARSYVAGMDVNAFTEDMKTRDAVVRQLEILGEAAKRVSDSLKTQHSNIPWKLMTGMRDKLIHDYRDVDTLAVWETATEDLQTLEPLLEALAQE
jgi:uncharacterized protein with HEPN domain